MATLMSALGGGLVGLYIAVDCLFSRSSVWAVLIKVISLTLGIVLLAKAY